MIVCYHTCNAITYKPVCWASVFDAEIWRNILHPCILGFYSLESVLSCDSNSIGMIREVSYDGRSIWAVGNVLNPCVCLCAHGSQILVGYYFWTEWSLVT